MKKLLTITAIIAAVGLANPVAAQDSKAEEIGKDIKKGVKKAGNKTASVASKGKAKITDEAYKGKVGPDGQTIYIDNHSRYYWVDDKGKRNYVTEAQLKDKPKD